jgi:3-oxoacyl-[acyl-carrier-protein] synthase III
MIGISYIAGYISENHLYNKDKKKQFDIDDDFITNKIGVERVSRKLPDEETSDMCIKAFYALTKKLPLTINDVDCIIVCTQNPDGNGIPHTSAIVHGKLNALEECASFDISLGCSGYVYGLSIAKSFMESNNLKSGLLFTADPYSKIIDHNDKNTSLLFGDAATVTLLIDITEKSDIPLWVPVKFLFGTRGKDGDALQNTEGRLVMNGRAVFNFSATVVPVQVKNLLNLAGLSLEDIDLFIFHQGSKYIIDTIRKRLALPADKTPFNIYGYGNTISSSIPLIFEQYMGEEKLNKVVMSGFGVGLSWASCILEKT